MRQFDPNLAAFIIRSPIEAIAIFEEHTNNIIQEISGDNQTNSMK